MIYDEHHYDQLHPHFHYPHFQMVTHPDLKDGWFILVYDGLFHGKSYEHGWFRGIHGYLAFWRNPLFIDLDDGKILTGNPDQFHGKFTMVSG